MFDEFGWVVCYDGIGFNIFGDDGLGVDDSMVVNGYVFVDKGVIVDLDIIVDFYWFEGWIGVNVVI